MTQTLTITSYIGHSHPIVSEALQRDPAPVAEAVQAAAARVDELEATKTATGDPDVRADGSALRIVGGSAELDGATITFSPVGDDRGRLTAVTVRLAAPFQSGASGRRQFLAASSVVARSAEAIDYTLAS